MCVWFPGWSLGRSDAPAERALDRGCLVVSESHPSHVVACTPDATDAGVERGMRRRVAEALCPGVMVLTRDVGEETQRFEPVVVMLEDLIPRIEVVEPGMVMIPVAGASTYYGGETTVVELVSGKLMGSDVPYVSTARVGLADGPFAAGWAARRAEPGVPLIVDDTRAFLAGLAIDALVGEGLSGVPPGAEELAATFRWLGVSTLGALADLPREAIASRFGSSGLSMHRLAHGEDRLLDPRPIPSEFAIEMEFEDEPLESVDQVAFVARAIAARMIPALQRHGIAPHRMRVEMTAADSSTRSRVWSSPDPFDEAALTDRVRWQIRAWIESGSVPGGVTRIRLDPSDLSGRGRQLGLFEDASASREADRALARAQALVGPGAVLQADPSGGRLPREQINWRRWGEPSTGAEQDPAAPWPGATPAPTPALVPERPQSIEVEWDSGLPVRIRLGARWEPILTWSGPWRMTGRWWNGRVASDRYQLVTSAGAFLCVVAEGMTYLVGVYD